MEGGINYKVDSNLRLTRCLFNSMFTLKVQSVKMVKSHSDYLQYTGHSQGADIVKCIFCHTQLVK